MVLEILTCDLQQIFSFGPRKKILQSLMVAVDELQAITHPGEQCHDTVLCGGADWASMDVKHNLPGTTPRMFCDSAGIAFLVSPYCRSGQ